MKIKFYAGASTGTCNAGLYLGCWEEPEMVVPAEGDTVRISGLSKIYRVSRRHILDHGTTVQVEVYNDE